MLATSGKVFLLFSKTHSLTRTALSSVLLVDIRPEFRCVQTMSHNLFIWKAIQKHSFFHCVPSKIYVHHVESFCIHFFFRVETKSWCRNPVLSIPTFSRYAKIAQETTHSPIEHDATHQLHPLRTYSKQGMAQQRPLSLHVCVSNSSVISPTVCKLLEHMMHEDYIVRIGNGQSSFFNRKPHGHKSL